MKKEQAIRISILNEAKSLPGNRGIGYHKPSVENEIALELIYEDLVIGSESEYGSACITGIRDAGLDYLEKQTPRGKAISAIKKIAFIIYSALLLVLGYFFSLDAVKDWFSDRINNKIESNQQVDPTVKTPVESGNEQGTAGHP